MSITHLWLAASPDGLVTDPQEDIACMVEYNPPYNTRKVTIAEVVEKVKDLVMEIYTKKYLDHPYQKCLQNVIKDAMLIEMGVSVH